jgi:aspartate-semialdehyde dehydrogenase
MDPEIPLVVPEVNPEALEGFRTKNIIANPNCSTIQMVVALKPLHDIARIRRVVVATYQSVSGAGQEGMDELFEQTKSIFMNDKKAPQVFPQADRLQLHPPGSTAGSMTARPRRSGRLVVETRKILDPGIESRRHLRPCARLRRPTRSASTSSSRSPSTPGGGPAALHEFSGVLVVDRPEDEEYATQIDCVGDHAHLRLAHQEGPDPCRTITASPCGWSRTTSRKGAR